MLLFFNKIILPGLGILAFVVALEYLIKSEVDLAVNDKIRELKELSNYSD